MHLQLVMPHELYTAQVVHISMELVCNDVALTVNHVLAALQQQNRQIELGARSAKVDDEEMQQLAGRLQQLETVNSQLQSQVADQVIISVMLACWQSLHDCGLVWQAVLPACLVNAVHLLSRLVSVI